MGGVASAVHWICRTWQLRGAIIVEEEIDISGTQIERRPFEADIMPWSTTGAMGHEGINQEDRMVGVEDIVDEELTVREIQERVHPYTGDLEIRMATIGLRFARNPKRVADVRAISAAPRLAGLVLRILRHSPID